MDPTIMETFLYSVLLPLVIERSKVWLEGLPKLCIPLVIMPALAIFSSVVGGWLSGTSFGMYDSLVRAALGTLVYQVFNQAKKIHEAREQGLPAPRVERKKEGS